MDSQIVHFLIKTGQLLNNNIDSTVTQRVISNKKAKKFLGSWLFILYFFKYFHLKGRSGHNQRVSFS